MALIVNPGTAADVLASVRFDDIMHPLLAGALADLDPGAVERYIIDNADESLLMRGIASLPIINARGQALMVNALRERLGRGGVGVGSMHNYGADLGDIAPALLDGVAVAVGRIIKVLFEPDVSLPLQTHSAHVIGYGLGATRERALKLHVDDST